jgi:hypothetical protein
MHAAAVLARFVFTVRFTRLARLPHGAFFAMRGALMPFSCRTELGGSAPWLLRRGTVRTYTRTGF